MSMYPPSTTIPIYSVLTGVGIILTTFRIYTRLSRSSSPSSHNSYPSIRTAPISFDDFFIVLGLIVVITCTGLQYHNALDGLSGAATSPTDHAAEILVEHKIDFSMIVIEKLAFGAIKLSLLFFYDHIFGHWPSFARLNRIPIVLVLLWAISFFLADILLCGWHPELQWGVDQMAARRGWGDKGQLLIAFAATSVGTDLAVLGLPLMYIRRLKMRRGKKVGASLVFLLGGISTMAGVLRLIFLCVAYPLGRVTWDYQAPPHSETPLVLRVFNPTFWVMVEMCLGVWAANLPALAPLAQSINVWSGKVYRGLSISNLVARNSPGSKSTVGAQEGMFYVQSEMSSKESHQSV